MLFPVFWSSVILVQSYLFFVSLECICYFIAWINTKSVKECGPFYYMLVVPEFNFKMKHLILLSIQNLLDFLWLFLNAFWFAIHLSQRHLFNNHASPNHCTRNLLSHMLYFIFVYGLPVLCYILLFEPVPEWTH